MSDNYPFDRHHVLVSVTFPVAELARRDALYETVRGLAARRGGREAGSAEPVAEFVGRPGYTTFGVDIAFEAGDCNIGGFVAWTEEALASAGVAVAYDPGNVLAPDGPDEPSSFRR